MKHNMRTDARQREREIGEGRDVEKEKERDKERERSQRQTEHHITGKYIVCVSVCGSNNFVFVWANIVAR